jgi:hypothetical protein
VKKFENETLLIQNHLGLTPDPCGIIIELWRLSLTFETSTGAMESNPGAVDALIGALEVHHRAMETHFRP